ncbi:acetylornithine aminotransferase [Piedraia hortae CBS 480.64]|uniref:acetylornithine transaminase n=1 Tax=Piedraia hortae CBS 480.64 TaxID=1314780 RepID=A0A6A7BY49_9PEZI|nr:acetylornithine aminotransferase [Piedraia hortae CBS 480.64]
MSHSLLKIGKFRSWCARTSYSSARPLISEDAPTKSRTGRILTSHAPFFVPTYSRPHVVFEKGKGCQLWDVEGRRYLDFTAGIAVTSLGHCDEALGQVLSEQAQTLVHSSNLFYNPWTGALSQLLVEKTREASGFPAHAAFICNSGSEANEAALKFARKYGRLQRPSKTNVVSFHGAFHGRTMGALSATPNPKYQQPFAPMLAGFRQAAYNKVDGLRELITEDTCGVIVEPIQGEGGVNEASVEFLRALRQRCSEVDAVLIYDEIQCGLSRTGSLWAHCGLPTDVHPDVVTTAKALGNGYPIGATLANEAVTKAIAIGDHGTTFGGNPLGCRAAHHILTRLADPELQWGVVEKGKRLRQHFDRLRERFPKIVGETRGRGLILGLQLHCDPGAIVNAARERGLLVITCGTNTLRLVPALTVSNEEIDEGVEVLADAMASTL